MYRIFKNYVTGYFQNDINKNYFLLEILIICLGKIYIGQSFL